MKESNAEIADSSKQNRNLLIFYLGFYVYAMISVGLVNGKSLVANESLNLPLIGINVPIIGFTILTPLLFLVLHFDFLFNVSQHLTKMRVSQANNPSHNFFPYLFNYVMVREYSGLVFGLLWGVSVFAPICLIFFNQWKSSALHSVSLTLANVVIASLLLTLIRWFWRSINTIVISHVSDSMRRIVKWMTNLTIWIFIGASLANLFCVIMINTDSEYQNFAARYGMPNLSLSEVIILPASEEETALRILKENGISRELERNRYTAKDLSNRNLRFANLSKAIFVNVNFEKSDLSYANLTGAIFIRCRFSGANLHNSWASGLTILDSDFSGSLMYNGTFFDLKIVRSRFVDADLSGTKFHAGEITDSTFSDAFFDGSWFSDVRLLFDSFIRGHFRGTRFDHSNLIGVEITGADFLGANLNNAFFVGIESLYLREKAPIMRRHDRLIRNAEDQFMGATGGICVFFSKGFGDSDLGANIPARGLQKYDVELTARHHVYFKENAYVGRISDEFQLSNLDFSRHPSVKKVWEELESLKSEIRETSRQRFVNRLRSAAKIYRDSGCTFSLPEKRGKVALAAIRKRICMDDFLTHGFLKAEYNVKGEYSFFNDLFDVVCTECAMNLNTDCRNHCSHRKDIAPRDDSDEGLGRMAKCWN